MATRDLGTMALSSGRLVTTIISPRAGKGDPDCSKTKVTVQLHPREYFPALLPIPVRMRDWFLGKSGFPRV